MLQRLSQLFQASRPPREPCNRKIQIMSDLHLELNRQYTEFDFPVTAPLLLLGGDIGRMIDYEMFLPFLARQTARYERVFLVLGNHEFYEMSYDEGIKSARRMEKEAVLEGKLTVLHRERWDDSSSGLTIIGATLWSKIPTEAEEWVSKTVSDFKMIKGWSCAEHNLHHEEDLAYLTRTVTELNSLPPESQRTVFIATHHAPLIKGASRPEHVKVPWRTAFSTDVVQRHEFAQRVAVWMFGHTHFTTELQRGGVKVVANQRGYVLGFKGPTLEDTRGFDDGRVVEL